MLQYTKQYPDLLKQLPHLHPRHIQFLPRSKAKEEIFPNDFPVFSTVLNSNIII